MSHTLFVYGTLKRGFPNHETLTGGTFAGLARTVEAWPLLIQGPWFTPVMLPETGEGHRVAGELWEVDDALLARLDQLESTHLPTGYVRREIAVERDDGSRLSAHVWLKARERCGVIHSGPHADYTDRRYIPASKRG